MKTNAAPSAQNHGFSSNGEGGTSQPPESEPTAPPPLAKRVQAQKQGFLNRTLEGKPIRHSYACRGRKSRKRGASRQSLHRNHNEVHPHNYRGSYLPVRFEIAPALAKLKRTPLSDSAKDLLAEYLRRAAFWDAVQDGGIPVSLAGTAYLGVQKRRAELVLKELEDVEGPGIWFDLKAEEGLKSGKIARGAATVGCQIADLFFEFLAGGGHVVASLMLRNFGGTEVGYIGGEYQDASPIEQEIIEYFQCKFLDDNPKPKKKKPRQ